MLEITTKELIKTMDESNEKEFKYVAILFNKSGYRPMVEASEKFIKSLNKEPFNTFKILNKRNPKLMEWEKHAIILDVGFLCANIYKYAEIKEILEKQHEIRPNKERPIIMLNFEEE